ncbi:fimbrial protein [Providencia sp. Me31A]|uniref:fimbrial protein n=1 Tax=Providencia sp. Me31A TaxID=3392637 RepID=UPI003D2DE9EF
MKEKIKCQSVSVVVMRIIFTCGLGVWSQLVLADNQVNMILQGRLLDFPPCEVYGDGGKGAPIRVGFDEIAIQRIDGQHFRKNWILNVSCDVTLGSNIPIKIEYNGATSEFDQQALQTDKVGLGVRLYQVNNGQVVKLNTPYTLTMSSNGERQISLYAVPVKNPGITLTPGRFTASATLALNYP